MVTGHKNIRCIFDDLKWLLSILLACLFSTWCLSWPPPTLVYFILLQSAHMERTGSPRSHMYECLITPRCVSHASQNTCTFDSKTASPKDLIKPWASWVGVKVCLDIGLLGHSLSHLQGKNQLCHFTTFLKLTVLSQHTNVSCRKTTHKCFLSKESFNKSPDPLARAFLVSQVGIGILLWAPRAAACRTLSRALTVTAWWSWPQRDHFLFLLFLQRQRTC